MSWMYGRTTSMPAGSRSTASSTMSRVGSSANTSHLHTSHLRNATAYDRDSATSGYVSSTSNQRVTPTTSSSTSYSHGGMGEPSYSSSPQFDQYGHNIRGPTTSSVASRNINPATTSSSSYLHQQHTSSAIASNEAYRKLMSAADESSSNASRINSSILPPSRGTTGNNYSSGVDRNPLQFNSDVYNNNNISNGRRSSQGLYHDDDNNNNTNNSTSSSSLYYRERTGAHNYNSPSAPSSQNRNASAAISSGAGARRTLQDYDRYGPSSMAYGASVTNSTSNNNTNTNNSTSSVKPKYNVVNVSDDDDDDEDGVHISAACKGGAGLGLRSSGNYSGSTPPISPSISETNIRKLTGSSSMTSSSALVPVGLRNIGNTCYMNASLQCILHASGFFLNSLPAALNQSASGKSKLTKALSALAKASSLQDLMAVKSGAATLNHEFQGGRQNDAHEFIREFLHALHLELNRVGKAPYSQMKDIEGETDMAAAKRWFSYFRSHDDSMVTDYFGGFMRSTTMCGTCGHRSLSFSPVWDLSLSMSSSGSSGSNITAMIKDFMKVDVLGADAAFSCEKCKKKRQGKRQSLLVNWPRVLVLHLCRFTYSGSRNSQSVDFPARLEQDMMPVPSSGSTTITGEAISGYSLSGVVLHRGTASFGHYTSLVRPFGSRNWYNCDDSNITPISENEVLRHRTEAYVLFYTMDEI